MLEHSCIIKMHSLLEKNRVQAKKKNRTVELKFSISILIMNMAGL